MNDEQLIESVRAYPVLYDLSHAKYLDTNLKKHIWNKIGQEMKTDGLMCKARWNNIRDNYRKSLKKTETRSGNSAKAMRIYKYSEQLSFLKKYFHSRDTKGQKIEDVQQDSDSQYEFEEKVQDDTEEYVSGYNEDPLSPNPIQNDTFEIPAKPSKQLKSAAERLVEYIISINEKEASASTQDTVDAFLAGIAPTLKTFNPYCLNLAKSEIFNVVQKYEMKMLMEQQDSYGRTGLNVNTNFDTKF